jgi:regulator of replication initiation timing
MADNDKFDDDDFFDKLEKDIDIEDDLKEDDPSDKDGDKDQEDPKDSPNLEERLAALEKENKGLKKAVVEYRQGKSQFKTELDELKGIIKDGLSNRGAETDDNKDGDNTDDKSGKLAIEKLPLEFDDDGKGYVKLDKLQESLQELIQGTDNKVKDLESKLTEDEALKAELKSREKHLNEILEAKPGRDLAWKDLTKGLKVLDGKVKEMIKERNFPDHVKKYGLTPGEALKLLHSEEGALDDFNKLNLGVDLELVIRMTDSDWDLEKALDAYAPQDKSKPNDDDDILNNLKNKPSGHGSVANRKGTGGSVLDKVASFSTNDILDLPDDTVDKLMERMRREARE